MLPREYKFLLRSEVDFFQSARRKSSRFITVFTAETPMLDHMRFAVIVPKKGVPLATKRAKIKRMITQALSEIISDSELKTVKSNKLACVIVAHHLISTLSVDEFKQEFLHLLKSIL